MKQIRKSVFETNSSSTHSLCISGGELEDSYLRVNDDFETIVELGEFGWEIEEYSGQYAKASYLFTILQYNDELTELAKEAITEYTKTQGVEVRGEGYVDHQSSDTLDELFVGSEKEIKQNMINFVFNSGYTFNTDNDNH